MGTSVEGDGVPLKVHITKKVGAPVRYIGGDDPAEAAALREVDLRKKFHTQSKELAEKLKITVPRSKLLRETLGIDGNPTCRHVFEFGSQKIPCYSDNALRLMKEWLAANSIDDLWSARQRA